MKFFVDQNQCIGCGMCESTCEEVFQMTDEGVASAIDEDVAEEYIDAANEALEGCPVSCISSEE